jgi:glutamyl-tRNA synthetase/glutamyl-Q tRNA(Asp) synthetase
MLQRLLGVPTPRYRHHFLLLEPPRGQASPHGDADPAAPGAQRTVPREPGAGKLAKLHGSIPFSQLRARHDGAALCGLLAHAAGLAPTSAPCRPSELVAAFDWQRVPRCDHVARWDERGLSITDEAAR